MILVDTKVDTKQSLGLNLSTPDEEPTLSFSQLLKGAGKEDSKSIQNGVLILALGDESKDVDKVVKKAIGKKEGLLSLLKNETTLELNPTLTSSLTSQELKTLIVDAKNYLKVKILDSKEYKEAITKELPKTLKGLMALSKQFGIDISKLSIEEIQIVKKDTKAIEIKPIKNDDSIATKMNNQQNMGQTKQTPLFKAQTQIVVEHTTQQMVATKLIKPEPNSSKEKVDDTLKLLLRGEKPSLGASTANLTSDFSVSTAKVIAPSASSSDMSKSLEALLYGEQNEASSQTTTSKTDGLATQKSDSFEVKLNEAKQMIKYLSQDVKTAIEDYKSPFTRVKIQLNPHKLGEVDLTIVQRGKNLHVNLSSNSSAINTLAINANELRTQLSNSGINNASLNFNNQQENSQNTSQQQQNHQNEAKADEEYNYFKNEETNEEIISSLEIIVPSYA